MKPRTDQELLRDPGKFLVSPSAIQKGVKETIKQVAGRTEQKEYYKQYEPEQYKLTIGYICNSLKEMGMDFKVGKKINVEALAKEFAVIKDQNRLFHHMFKLLKDAGVVSGGNGAYTVTKTPDFRDVRAWMDSLANMPRLKRE